LFENIDGYYAVFIAGLKSRLVYKKDWVMWMLVRFAAALVMVLVFTAIYLGSGTTSIKGFTLPFIYSYFFIENAIWFGISTDILGQMQDDIQGGTVASALIKPISYTGRLLSNGLANTSMSLIAVCLPLLVVGIALSGVAISLQTALVFAGELVIAYGLYSVFSFLIGTTAVYLVEVWAVSSIYWGIVGIMNGVLMPLSFLPVWLQNILTFTPFPAMAYTEVSTLLGTVSSQYIIETMASGAIWLAVLACFAYLWWGRVRKDITSAGG
jgi:ABC-2 type transport system permease protein